MNSLNRLFISGSVLLSLLLSSVAFASDDRQYEVTITNTTKQHVFTPVFIATHDKDISLFHVGGTASEGLAFQAENGDPSMLLGETQSHHGIDDTVIGGFVPYGTSATYTISADKKSRLTLTTMLATTNDAFAALNAVNLPKKSHTYYAYAYDAGSEANNEDCDFIPGPPCTGGNARSTADAEGFISIHNGVHGIASLSASDLDWRGPVAIVTITRLDD